VDGVVVCPHALVDEMLTEVDVTRPVVQLGGAPTELFDCVVMGEREGSEAMTRHLLDTGRRRIALVWNGPEGATPAGDRYEGYLDALDAYGVPTDEALYVAGSDWDRRASGYEAMVGLLRSRAQFDAALCVNDAIAVGALRALRSHGVRVPQDVAVAGFDDTEEAGFTTPSLSSVSPQQGEMVAAAVRMLIERLGGHAGPARQVRTRAHVVVRESTAVR
jgi:DNA-binding LacI/PurR family transcriptional regulator